MKVAIYVEHFRISGEGAENHAMRLLHGLGQRGHEVHAICRSGDTSANPNCLVTRFAAEDGGGSVHVHQEADLAADEACALRQNADLIADWGLNHLRADVYFVNGGLHQAYVPYAMPGYSAVGQILKRLKCRFGRESRVIERQNQLIHQATSTFLAISRFVADPIIALGVPAERVTVLHCGVDDRKAADPAVRETSRRAWKGVTPSSIVCLWAAHNRRLKNLDFATRICRAARAAGQDVHLLVVGKRPPRVGADWLHYLGCRHDMDAIYAGADVLLHPTWYDAFGNVVLEAMSAGLSVLVSNRAGVCEIIEQGQNGLILPVDPRDVAPWTNALVQLGASPDERRRVGAAARDTAQGLSFGAYISAVDAYFQRCLRAKKART